MSTTYKTAAGDTFETVARRVYGDARQADRIRKANPGAAEPLPGGVALAVPADQNGPPNQTPTAAAASRDEVAVSIGGKRFRFWETVRITRGLDMISAVELTAPFEPDVPGFRETFRPFSFADMDVIVGGVPLFSGTMLSPHPTIGGARTVDVAGYGRAGVLADCTAPASAFPLEFNGQTLEAIAKTVADFFGLAVVFKDSPGAVFDRVALDPGVTALAFLADLARQRGLVIGDDEQGRPVFQRGATAGLPVATLAEGASPVTGVRPAFSPQDYYSHITGIEPVLLGSAGSQFTVKNARLPGVIRPLTFQSQDSADADIKTATEAKAGRMIGNMAAYSVEVATWRDARGGLWAPNTLVTLHAPGAMVYRPFTFLLRSVALEATRAARSATLDLVIPGAFRGQIPEVLPWDA